MTILSQEFRDEQRQSKSILGFAKEFNLAQLLAKANVRKAKGVGVLKVFVELVSTVFTGKPLSRRLADGELSGKKDVFYRFMNSSSANWMKFIRILSSQLITRIKGLLDNSGVLVLDDTIHKRDRSKNVELLTRVRDHNDGRYYRGFRCLTLCFHIERATIPVDFRLLSSHKEKTRIHGIRQNLDKRTNGYKLRQYAVSQSFQMAFDMLARQRDLVRHVLFDSWFAMPVMFKTLREMGFHGVGMLKTSNNLYRYKGKLYKLEALYAHVKPFIHHNNDVAALGVELRDGTPLSINFILDKRNKRDWLAIATTDLSLSPEQVVKLYARRWNIEVFFKTIKSYLGFATECQSRSFDAIVCSVAVVFTRHMILTWLNLGAPELETSGQLFFHLFNELCECTFSEALEIVLCEIANRLVHIDELLDLPVRYFVATLASCFKPLSFVGLCET